MKISVLGILFDMDGVLISSINSVVRSWTTWAKDRDVDPALAVQMAHGRRALETLRFLRPDLDGEEELRRLEKLEMEDTVDLKILGGVQRILQSLPADRWAVVTSATERLARRRLSDGGVPAPRYLVSADNVSKGKPDPEPYLMGAKLLGLGPQQCLVIEDAASGANAGHAAGCKVMGTLFSHSIESLSAADWIVGSLEDVHVTAVGERIEVEFEPVAREVPAR